MFEHDLRQVVEQARRQLNALSTPLEEAPGSSTIRSSLGDLLEILEQLQARHSLLREILAHSSDAVFAKDLEGRYVMINRIGAAMFGRSVEAIIGRDDTALFEIERAQRVRAIDHAVMSTGTPRTFEETFDIRGVPITMLTTETAWYEARGAVCGLIGTSRDVTERDRLERIARLECDRMRALATEMVIAEEQLRQSLAASLHDDLGQDLVLTKLKLSALRRGSSAALRDSLAGIEQLVGHADRSLRRITLQISPSALHDLGLVPALRWLAEDIGARHGLRVRIADEETPAVSDERMRVILFRAVRELLINIATHAEAKEALVSVGTGNRQLHITVKDEGAGFDPAGADLQGYGLFAIREQLRHLGGSMHIDSAHGRGTTVTLTAPLAFAVAATT